ncbi:MAG: HAD-superfamily hydrolase, subfamily (PSPase-like) [bacterium]|nr:HAD-superfamily hydrolase, subfamily (PSPase-like) [bacterium]
MVVLDFDGTVTQKDIGDEICDRFAPAAWRDIDAAWVRNEISLPDAQRKMWALARAERPEALAYAREIGHLRPGLDALMASVQRAGASLWLASGGFDFYIEALLGARLDAFERRYFNATRFADGKIEVDFPHAGLACGRCAVCKGKVCDEARATGRPVVFIGDGSSDRCAIGRADRLFAVRGSLLERVCAERGAACVPFDELGEVARYIDGAAHMM